MEIPLPLAPLVVGVTGHRDLRPYDVGRLRALVGRELDKLVADSPDTPLMLLSPLAEGADRLVAREALERDARLVVILPLEQESYEEDFETEESLIEFRELLAKAETVVTLPQGPDRNRQYALAGACVARHSNVLLALWDGRDEAGTGGTAQIVRFQRNGGFEDTGLQEDLQRLAEPLGPGNDPLARDESGAVIHIVTPRKRSPGPAKAFQVIKLAPYGFDVKQFFEVIEATNKRRNTFNQDLKRLWRVTGKDRKSRRNYLFPHHKVRQLPEALRALREQQAGADALASFFQSRTKRAVIGLNIVLFLAATAYTLYSNLMTEETRQNPWPLALYLLLLALAGGVYLFTEIRRVHNKFLDYRAVAEGLRVQFYWGLAGFKKPAADHYLRRQRGELEWISHVLRPWAIPLYVLPKPPVNFKRRVRRLWIRGQARYFSRRAPENRDLLLALTAVRNVLLVASLSLAVLVVVLFAERTSQELRIVVITTLLIATVPLLSHLVDLLRSLKNQPKAQSARRHLARGSLAAIGFFIAMGGALWGLQTLRVHNDLWSHVLDHTPDVWMMAAMELAIIAATLIFGYATIMALSDESKQYERMEKIFNAARKKARGPGWEALLEALGKEALAENGEWVLMHRERPVELQHP